MLEWMLMPLKRYADFSGRSRRKEFWMFQLLNIIMIAVFLGPIYRIIIGNMMSQMAVAPDGTYAPAASAGFQFGDHPIAIAFAAIGVLWALFVLIPGIAVTVRRLHDRDMSGWWYLGFVVLSIIPLIGIVASIGFLVVMCLEGTKGTNRFGADPKGGGTNPEVFS